MCMFVGGEPISRFGIGWTILEKASRLTSYMGGTPVQNYEREDLAALAGEFRVGLRADLPVTEARPFDDSGQGLMVPAAAGPARTRAAQHAGTGAAKAARFYI
jgi:hypothetical protein